MRARATQSVLSSNREMIERSMHPRGLPSPFFPSPEGCDRRQILGARRVSNICTQSTLPAVTWLLVVAYLRCLIVPDMFHETGLVKRLCPGRPCRPVISSIVLDFICHRQARPANGDILMS